MHHRGTVSGKQRAINLARCFGRRLVDQDKKIVIRKEQAAATLEVSDSLGLKEFLRPVRDRACSNHRNHWIGTRDCRRWPVRNRSQVPVSCPDISRKHGVLRLDHQPDRLRIDPSVHYKIDARVDRAADLFNVRGSYIGHLLESRH